MTIFHKFGLSFILALSLHLLILGAFALNIMHAPDLVTQKPLPDIIQASILDDNKIQQEANRLKTDEENKRIEQIKKKQYIENQRKKEQQLLAEAKQKRIQEQNAAKILADKRKKQVLEEQKKLEQIKQQEIKEAARLAKIKQHKEQEVARLEKLKQQKLQEQKRQDELKKAERRKRQLAIQAEKKKQQAIRERQQKEAADQLAFQQRQAQDKKTTVSVTAAIQSKVNSKWIRPLSSVRGLTCTIRVKLLPSGDVMDAHVIKSSGDSAFDNAAENAVHKASPLPVPESRALFSKNFRSFTFNFNPK